MDFGISTDNERRVVHVDNDVVASTVASFEACEVGQLAFRTILAELDQCDFKWNTGLGGDDTIPVSIWRSFVRDTVSNFLAVGFSGHVRLGIKNGFILARAVAPTEVTAVYKRGVLLKLKLAGVSPLPLDTTVKCTTLYPPHYATGKLASPAHNALELSQRYKMIVANFMERDKRNSTPAVFTSVSKEISASSDTSTWFSPRAGSSYHDRDFQALVAQRERALHELGSITEQRRTEPQEHLEHVITDGLSHTEARPLLSQPDTRTTRDQTYSAILKCYKVPPAALGEQVNAERAGVGLGSSSHAMTSRAVRNFKETIKSFIEATNKALKSASKTPDGNFVMLEQRMPEENVIKMLPYLKPNAAAKLMSDLYDIPLKDVDPSRFDPQTTAEPDRKQKRTRIEQEQAAATA